MGLHLRTGKDVVRIASQFEAEITAKNLTHTSDTVDVKSILQLMQLQARRGHTLLLCASGPDAHEALNALVSLF
jgi:phosphotransferase system HPr (HPr) family protein